MKQESFIIQLFQELTSVPTAPFYEQAVSAVALAWIKRSLGRKVSVKKCRGGIIVRYTGAGPGPALAFAAHMDHPAFHLSAVTAQGARAKLQGGLIRDLLPGAAVDAFAARPKNNKPEALGLLGKPEGDFFPVTWTSPPARGARPVFAVLALPPFSIEEPWLLSRSMDDLLGCAISLEALRQIAEDGVKTNLTVLLHRAEEVGFIGALDMIKAGLIDCGDSILSIETSKELPDAVPGRGPVVRVGDKSSLFDPNLLILLDEAAAALASRGVPTQRTRLTGGSCEATAYLAFGYESAGVSVPLVNYHNGGPERVEPEKVRLEDVQAGVQLLIEAARRFPEAILRGRLSARLTARHRELSKGLK